MINISVCPICQSSNWHSILKVRDHSISNEIFGLLECKECSLLVTSPRPSEENLSTYYQSENYISHSGKGNNLINKLYLTVRSFSLKWKLKLINNLAPKGKILDVGCGTGEFLNTLKKDGWAVSGIEPSSSARQMASQLVSAEIKESFEGLKGPFDVITLWHVMEHLSSLESNFKSINEILSPRGTLVIAVPNHKSWDSSTYREYWAGYDVPRHLWHFNQKSMVLLLQKYGYQLIQTIPMKLDSFYVSMLSEKYKGNNSIIGNAIKGFLSGLSSNHKAKRSGEYSSLIYIAKK